MGAFIDARCRKCDKRIGWQGKMADMPACPRCGFRPPSAELEAEGAKMDAMLALMELNCADGKPEELRQKRLLSGLTLMQASRLAGMGPAELSGLENGRRRPTAEEAAILDQLYNGGE